MVMRNHDSMTVHGMNDGQTFEERCQEKDSAHALRNGVEKGGMPEPCMHESERCLTHAHVRALSAINDTTIHDEAKSTT